MVSVGKTVQYRVRDGATLRSRAALVMRVISVNEVDLFVFPETALDVPMWKANVLQGQLISGVGVDAAGTWRYCRQEPI